MKKRLAAFLGGLAATLALAMPTAATAQQDYVNDEKPQVQGETLNRPTVQADTETRGSLPITGGDIAGLTAIGAAAVGVGTVLVRRSRARQA